MNLKTNQYFASEFAALAGVSVRTLHHYDRLELLRPQRRSEAGYRLYCDADLVKLEQIVMLKFLGLPLKEIRELLNKETLELREALRRQLGILERKQQHLGRAVESIRLAEEAAAKGEPVWNCLKTIIQVIEMEKNDWEFTKKYYSEEAQAKVEERKALWTPELQEKVSRDWEELGRDIEAALSEDSAGPVAQALADRWAELLRGFTGGDREIQKGLNAMHADKQNWPVQYKSPYSEAGAEFIQKAFAARKSGFRE